MNNQEYIDYLHNKARAGDRDASVILGLEFASGKKVEKDLNQAEFWLREAASNGDEMPLYHLMRVHFAEDDERITQVFMEKYQWQYAVVYLLYGSYLVSKGEIIAAKKILYKGYCSNNIPSGIAYFTLMMKTNIINPLYVARLVILGLKFAFISVANSDDPRIERYK